MDSATTNLTSETLKKTLKKNFSNIRNPSIDDLNRKNKVSFENTKNPSINIDKDFIDRCKLKFNQKVEFQYFELFI